MGLILQCSLRNEGSWSDRSNCGFWCDSSYNAPEENGGSWRAWTGNARLLCKFKCDTWVVGYQPPSCPQTKLWKPVKCVWNKLISNKLAFQVLVGQPFKEDQMLVFIIFSKPTLKLILSAIIQSKTLESSYCLWSVWYNV